MTKPREKEVLVPAGSPTWRIAYIATGFGVLAGILWLVYQALATSDGLSARDYPIAFLFALAPLIAGVAAVYLIAWRKTRSHDRETS